MTQATTRVDGAADTKSATSEIRIPRVTREAWTAARLELLARERAFTHERDALSAARRAMPMVKVDENYVFEESSGERRLIDLFGPHRQLVVYHFMFAPNWEAGCRSCSLVADNFDGGVVHLAARNTAFAAISRAPSAKLEAFKKRMGWSFRWLSSERSTFNYDFAVSFPSEDVAAGAVDYNYRKMAFPLQDAPGVSVFLREGDEVFHTYSTYSRGVDLLIGTYNYLDLTPLGRHEDGRGMSWLRHHDDYGPR